MRISCLSIILLLISNVYAESTLDRYTRMCFEFNKTYPQEKVYLHMDNRSYFIGDTIWFKAYVMNATTLHPTQTSGVLYVELLNDFGAEMERKKLEIKNGMCHGEFALNDNYRTGFYEIRAYTRNMLNFGENSSLLTAYGWPMTYVEPVEFELPSLEEENSYTISPPTVSTVYSPIEYDEEDSLIDTCFIDAVEIAIEHGKISTSLIQRKLYIGYACRNRSRRTARLLQERRRRDKIRSAYAKRC